MRKAPTAAQKEKAELRRAAFRALVHKVAAMTPEQREAIINKCGGIVTCEGRTLSAYNSCLVLMQNEAASMVGGFQQWLKTGRAVVKGQHGIGIWIPTMGKATAEPEGDEGAEVRFLMGTVFDIGQTQPVEAK